jgi:alkylation response protein AidB-like acyl-CoA dehydrogenase
MNSTVQEAQAFLAENWKPSNDLAAWREKIVDAKWAALRWPTEWFGRGLDDDAATEVENVFRAAGVPGPGQDKSNLWAGTLLSYGNDEMKSLYLRKLLL